MKQKLIVTTRWLIIVTGLVWIGWDVVAIWLGGAEATESYQITEFAARSLPVSFGLGFLMGHWLWPKVIKINDNESKT